jgi:hypothetical protein
MLTATSDFPTEMQPRCFVGFEVLIAAVMKSTFFWEITPCSLLINGLHGVISKEIMFCYRGLSRPRNYVCLRINLTLWARICETVKYWSLSLYVT